MWIIASQPFIFESVLHWEELKEIIFPWQVRGCWQHLWIASDVLWEGVWLWHSAELLCKPCFCLRFPSLVWAGWKFKKICLNFSGPCDCIDTECLESHSTSSYLCLCWELCVLLVYFSWTRDPITESAGSLWSIMHVFSSLCLFIFFCHTSFFVEFLGDIKWPLCL